MRKVTIAAQLVPFLAGRGGGPPAVEELRAHGRAPERTGEVR